MHWSRLAESRAALIRELLSGPRANHATTVQLVVEQAPAVYTGHGRADQSVPYKLGVITGLVLGMALPHWPDPVLVPVAEWRAHWGLTGGRDKCKADAVGLVRARWPALPVASDDVAEAVLIAVGWRT